jgi:tRNA pseudouridine38-40 synthase
MPRYKLTIAYDGTDFHGWQKQSTPDREPPRTVQQEVEAVIRDVMREPIFLQGASRTDAGVHALGQVAAFTSERTLAPRRLRLAVNSRLPGDVQVRGAQYIRRDFEPISDAVGKHYRYTIAHGLADGAVPAPLFDRNQVMHMASCLDVNAMQHAAKHIIGRRDFASFTRTNHGKDSTVRTVTDCTVTASNPHRLRIDVHGGGFLYNMVRIIAGTLTEVGRGKITPADVPAILKACDRSAAGPTLPPQGLCLMRIRY